MKVKELIEALEKVENQDAEVLYGQSHEGSVEIVSYNCNEIKNNNYYPESADFVPKERKLGHLSTFDYIETCGELSNETEPILSIWLGCL